MFIAVSELPSVMLVFGVLSGCLMGTQSYSCEGSGSANVTIRWSSTSDRLYLEGGGCFTLSDIFKARLSKSGLKGPLYPYDASSNSLVENITGQWYLESSLYVIGDSKLVVRGTALGGDCDRLLLASNSEKYINVRMHGGNAWFEGTHVQSWDLKKWGGLGGVDEEDKDGRSYISAISEVITDPSQACDGMALSDMGEAQLDILDSEIDHLGWYDSESYGISYKVRGYCKDHSNPEIFDKVAVTGDIKRSHIHHCYFGHYSYGHQGGDLSGNTVHDNVGYGFDPHDDSDYITIHDNHVYNNGWHGIIASKRCDHVSIKGNVVHNNGKNGIMLHRSCDYAIVADNTAYDNADAGLAIYESSNIQIYDNYFYHNKYGIRWSMGSSDCSAHSNRIIIKGEHEKYAIFMYRGSDEPDVPGSDGRPRRNKVYNNDLITDNYAMKITDAEDTYIEGNVITGDRSRFSESTNTMWKGNSVETLYEFKVEDGACFSPGSDILKQGGLESFLCH